MLGASCWNLDTPVWFRNSGAVRPWEYGVQDIHRSTMLIRQGRRTCVQSSLTLPVVRSGTLHPQKATGLCRRCGEHVPAHCYILRKTTMLQAY